MTGSRSDLEWMELQVDGLFVHDRTGRLSRRNQPAASGKVPPPRFFLGRTRMGSLWRFGAGVPEPCASELARLAAAEREGRPLEDPPERMEALRARLEREAPIEHVYHGPAFHFPAPESLRDASLETLLVTPERAEVLAPHFAELAAELPEWSPVVAALDGEGRAVSTCCCATLPQRNGTVEAGVDTAPGFRRRGLGARVVAAWSWQVRERGWTPLYSTTWDNRASRGVARRLGLIPFGVDLHFR